MGCGGCLLQGGNTAALTTVNGVQYTPQMDVLLFHLWSSLIWAFTCQRYFTAVRTCLIALDGWYSDYVKYLQIVFLSFAFCQTSKPQASKPQYSRINNTCCSSAFITQLLFTCRSLRLYMQNIQNPGKSDTTRKRLGWYIFRLSYCHCVW